MRRFIMQTSPGGPCAFIVQIDERLCKGTEGCSLCIWACPEDVIAPSTRLGTRGVRPAQVTREEACVGCGACMIYCPDLAVVVADREGVVIHV